MTGLGKSILAGMMLISAGLFGQGKPLLVINIEETKINMTEEEKKGSVQIVYSPSDTIEYTIIAENAGTGIMNNPEIVDPIPQGVVYVPGSALGENCRILFSLDTGKRFGEWPLMVTENNQRREARPDEITHIKWMMRDRIPAGEQRIVKFRVVVK